MGKTSLTRRFVTDTFDEGYVSTIGTLVSSKRFTLDDPLWPGSARVVGLSVWDIMGSHRFRDLLKDAFFLNASGVLLVFDVTRPETLANLPSWHDAVTSVAGPVPTIVLANKMDRRGPGSVASEAIDVFCEDRGWIWFDTSAKTGANVEAAFRRVATEHLLAARKGSETTIRA